MPLVTVCAWHQHCVIRCAEKVMGNGGIGSYASSRHVWTVLCFSTCLYDDLLAANMHSVLLAVRSVVLVFNAVGEESTCSPSFLYYAVRSHCAHDTWKCGVFIAWSNGIVCFG